MTDDASRAATRREFLAAGAATALASPALGALPEQDQFALEMDHMARRVAQGERPHTPGEEGLQDMRIIEAIYRAAETGKPVDLKAPEGKDTTRGPAPA